MKTANASSRDGRIRTGDPRHPKPGTISPPGATRARFRLRATVLAAGLVGLGWASGYGADYGKATAATPRVPLVLKKHVQAGDRLGYPHAATSSELGEAVTWVMRFTTRSLGRGVSVTCWTNQYGDAGWYACRIRNGNGRVRGVPRVYRSATLRVDWHGRPEITYRGRVPGGTASVRYAAGKNVSGAVYNCCHAEVGR